MKIICARRCLSRARPHRRALSLIHISQQIAGSVSLDHIALIIMEKQFPICHQISLHLIINILKDISTAVLGQKSVSYTHLDVYKRQIYSFRPSKLAVKSFSIAEKFVMRTEISCSIRALAMHPAK